MSKARTKIPTVDQIIARLEKPKSMRYIRRHVNPIFAEAKAKFGNAIVEIVEREHWGPNFDAYYDVWVRRRWSEIGDFFSAKLLELQLEKYIAVLAQIKEADDDREQSRLEAAANSKKHSRNGKLARLHA